MESIVSYFEAIAADIKRTADAVERLADRQPTQEPAPEPQPEPQPQPQPEPSPTPAPGGYPALVTGMKKPADFSPMSNNWKAGDYVFTTWQGGAGTMGNPLLADIRDNGEVRLTARHAGSVWNSGVMQFWKQTAGTGKWSAVLSSANPKAVCAFFTYADDGTELDFEYVMKNGTPGWQLGVHMPKSGGGRVSFGGIFVPYSFADFAEPALFEIAHSAASCRFSIGGKLVGEVFPRDMPSGGVWKTDAKMGTFFSVEKHGGWAGPWPYTEAEMTVYGIKLPGM